MRDCARPRVEAERVEAERIEAERVEAERIEAERVEAERIETERVEAERIEAERVEAERIARVASNCSATSSSMRDDSQSLSLFSPLSERDAFNSALPVLLSVRRLEGVNDIW